MYLEEKLKPEPEKPTLGPVENPEPVNPEPVKPKRLWPDLVINQIIHSSSLLPFQQTSLLPSSPSDQLGDAGDEEPTAKEQSQARQGAGDEAWRLGLAAVAAPRLRAARQGRGVQEVDTVDDAEPAQRRPGNVDTCGTAAAEPESAAARSGAVWMARNRSGGATRQHLGPGQIRSRRGGGSRKLAPEAAPRSRPDPEQAEEREREADTSR